MSGKRTGEGHAEAAAAAATKACSLDHQCGVRNGPAVVEAADDVGHWHAGFVDEHFVEHGAAGHFAQGAHLDAGLVHVEREVGDALMLWRVGVRAREQHSPVGVLAAAGPNLLTGDDVFVAIELGLAAEASKVGTGAWLAEQLTPTIGAIEDARNVGGLLLG